MEDILRDTLSDIRGIISDTFKPGKALSLGDVSEALYEINACLRGISRRYQEVFYDVDDTLEWRAVNNPHWRWMPGMQSIDGHRLADGATVGASWVPPNALPNLDDPATIGCLTKLVRDKYGAAWVTERVRGVWRLENDEGQYWDGGSEAEVLVLALETDKVW